MHKNKVTFIKNSESEFFAEVKERVNEYFLTNNISKNANVYMLLKTLFILAGTVASYLVIVFQLLNPWGLLLMAVVLGYFTALIGLNIAHDALHGSYSSNKNVNQFLGSLFNVVGANDYIWKIKHNIIHHTYTNVPELDDDINQAKILRMEPNQKLMKIHRFQHIYLFFLYPLSSLSWVFVKDYQKFFSAKISSHEIKNHPKKELFRLILYKLVYYIIYIVIPFTVIDLPWYYILLGFIVMHLIEGATLSFIFQLAHVFEGTSYPLPEESGKINNTWAEHQLYTTLDFGRKNPIVNFFFGGLNFQIEHHLFPKICHIHYSKISPIVQKTAEKYGLPYLENKTFFGALRSHVRMMKKMGSPSPVPA